MKNILLSLAFLMSIFSTSVANANGFGFTLSAASLDTDVKDDVDANGTTDTTKSLSNEIAFGSIFVEKSLTDNLIVGLDWIPFEAEFESRSTTQTSMGSTATQTSGTNKGTADVSNHLTFYIQPIASNGIFATLGYMTADVSSLVQSVSSTDKTVEQTLEGIKLGIGIKKDFGEGFVKIELSRNDYDEASVTTGNNTKVTADIDSTQLNLSVGKGF